MTYCTTNTVHSVQQILEYSVGDQLEHPEEKIAELALDLVDASQKVLWSPADNRSPVRIKITITTGPAAIGNTNMPV